MIEEIIKPSYMVGGSIRDSLLGLEPKDYDFATPLLPDDIEERVKASGRRAYITGKRFGTVGFKFEDKFVEVTTFRSEVYGKSRKPEVEFVGSLTEDLSRRDFTINAMAQSDKLIDPFGGKADLDAKIIRAVGNPTIRFKEDPLRMLRAARFASQLGFDIEPNTLKSMTKNAHLILTVSKERWIQELDKLLLGEASKGLQVLADTDLLKFILPELRLQVGYDQNNHNHKFTLAEHSFMVVDKLPKDITLRWAGLLHDIGKPFVRTENPKGHSNYIFHETVGAEMVYGIGKRLKWSNERLNAVQDLIANHLKDESPLKSADNRSKN
jgi:tRNA nucleotidyltransferase (CCA-adding enzyme)